MDRTSTEILRLRYATLLTNWACSEAAVDAYKPHVRNGLDLPGSIPLEMTRNPEFLSNSGRYALSCGKLEDFS